MENRPKMPDRGAAPKIPDFRKVSRETIEKMTDDKKIVDNDPDDEKKLMDEWESFMSDFVPEDINTVVIEPKSEVVCLAQFADSDFRLFMRMLAASPCMLEGLTSLVTPTQTNISTFSSLIQQAKSFSAGEPRKRVFSDSTRQ
jgi:hypothetical protein